MSDTLFLPLKAKWYDMIESGIKTEEYREFKEYWFKRLVEDGNFSTKEIRKFKVLITTPKKQGLMLCLLGETRSTKN